MDDSYFETEFYKLQSKVFDVIRSCKSKPQLLAADKFAQLASKRMGKGVLSPLVERALRRRWHVIKELGK